MTDETEVLGLIEMARDTGKIRKGANEATKALEKGNAKLVVYAADVSPKEVVMHLPLLSKENNAPCVEVKSKEALGAAAGLAVSTAAVAIVKEGDAKSDIEALSKAAKSAGNEEAPKEEEKKSEDNNVEKKNNDKEGKKSSEGKKVEEGAEEDNKSEAKKE